MHALVFNHPGPLSAPSDMSYHGVPGSVPLVGDPRPPDSAPERPLISASALGFHARQHSRGWPTTGPGIGVEVCPPAAGAQESPRRRPRMAPSRAATRGGGPTVWPTTVHRGRRRGMGVLAPPLVIDGPLRAAHEWPGGRGGGAPVGIARPKVPPCTAILRLHGGYFCACDSNMRPPPHSGEGLACDLDPEGWRQSGRGPRGVDPEGWTQRGGGGGKPEGARFFGWASGGLLGRLTSRRPPPTILPQWFPLRPVPLFWSPPRKIPRASRKPPESDALLLL